MTQLTTDNAQRTTRPAPLAAAWLTGREPEAEAAVPLEVWARRLGREPHAIRRLDTDENPYGPSLRALEVLGAAAGLHRAGDPEARDLRVALEGYLGINRERITVAGGLVGAGARLLRAALPPGTAVAVCPPGRGVHDSWAARSAHPLQLVPRRDKWALNLSGLDRALAGGAVGGALLASPNDPTGNDTNPTTIARLLRHGLPIIVDETWTEWAERSCARLAAEFDNLIIIRDWGPWAGLGGLPITTIISSRALAAELRAAGTDDPPGGAAQLALAAALEDRANLAAQVRQMGHERRRLFRQLRKLNLVDPYPGDAPFLLCAVRRGRAARIANRLADAGILIRPYATPALPNHLRISVGRPDDTDAVYQALLRLAAQATV